jgi:hypothetical protein
MEMNTAYIALWCGLHDQRSVYPGYLDHVAIAWACGSMVTLLDYESRYSQFESLQALCGLFAFEYASTRCEK